LAKNDPANRRKCLHCGKIFFDYPSQPDIYCGRKCSIAARPPATLYAEGVKPWDRIFLWVIETHFLAVRNLSSTSFDVINRACAWCRYPEERAYALIEQHPRAWERMMQKREARIKGQRLCTDAQLLNAHNANMMTRHPKQWRRLQRLMLDGLPPRERNRVIAAREAKRAESRGERKVRRSHEPVETNHQRCERVANERRASEQAAARAAKEKAEPPAELQPDLTVPVSSHCYNGSSIRWAYESGGGQDGNEDERFHYL
jgi:hypothetical protein